ncbi:MAG TPA: hypothetical protein VGV87_28225 [Blastocatellia bacterium]|nr:hypothetical protein [Blastocatellia bacterium]
MRHEIKQVIKTLAFVATISIVMACGANPQTEKLSGNTSVDNGKGKTAIQMKASFDPCTLLSKEDAEAALEGSVTRVTPQGLSTADTCQYMREKGGNLAQAGESVKLQIHFGSGKLFDSYVKDAEESFETKAQQVEAVGEKAVFNSGQLIVLNKNDFLVVTIGKKMSDAERLAATKTLAQKVVARL